MSSLHIHTPLTLSAKTNNKTENTSKMFDWTLARILYSNKKITKANEDSHYTPKSKWGEHIGYDFAPPFSVAELDDALTKKEITLPTAFYDYLTKVSREMFFSSYPVTLNLDTLPTREESQRVNIQKTRLSDDDFYYSDIDDDDNYQNKKNCLVRDNTDAVFIKIAHGGCVHYDVIYLGAGPHYGSVWYLLDDDVHGKTHNTFEEYLVENMKDRRDYIAKYMNQK